MEVTNNQYNDLLDELIKTLPPQLHPDEVTAHMVATASGYSINGARTLLDRQVSEGLLEKHKAIDGGKIVMAYKRKEK
jgi:GTPase